MYDHTRRYRCTIIRGKSQTETDNLLPLYAQIIQALCPCAATDFSAGFNRALADALPGAANQKTLDNHRTEIAGKLFGMYYVSADGTVYPSERTLKLLSDSDTPAFFKDICYKMQFPNGSQKWQTVSEHIGHRLCLRPFPFVIQVLLLAQQQHLVLHKKDIGYYILSALDVLQGKADPGEVIRAIAADRQQGIERSAGSGSYATQHLNEQINLLELANLVIIEGGAVTLNDGEAEAIALFAGACGKPPAFDVYAYDLREADRRKVFYADWAYYFSTLSDQAARFDTTVQALGSLPAADEAGQLDKAGSGAAGGPMSTTDLGDEGERFVYAYEKRRVTAFNPRLAGKVLHLGKTRGLGYDIQSVVAQPGDQAEFARFIEVKATKRVTAPRIDDDGWVDTLDLTRNEWIAAQQHGEAYWIFRVYFVRGRVLMLVVRDIAAKHEAGTLTAVPKIYRVDFSRAAVDQVIAPEEGGVGDV